MATEAIVDVVILTVLPEEYQAVCKNLTDLHAVPGSQAGPNLYAWQVGNVPCISQQNAYTVAVGMQGRAGTNQSALATVEAIKRWQPRYVFFVGIAGGLSSLTKGDVIVADVIYGYEYGKLEQNFLPRNNWSYHTDLGLLNGAVAYALQPEWRQRIQEIPPTPHVPKVISGEIASGDKVVDNPTNEFFAQVRKAWPKVRAVEMEGAGVGHAIEQAQAQGIAVGFLMIRSISDVPRPEADQADVRGTQERDNWKPYAADTAAAFTLGYLAAGLPMPPRGVRAPSVAPGSVSGTATNPASHLPGVFISHRKADAHLAERLAEEIRQAGFQVWFDEWDIRVGDSIVERINAGLETAKYVVLCYSESGVLSPWMSREWMAALARQLGGYSVKVLPVRLSGGTAPAILADIRYADLVEDWQRGVAELLRAMR